MNGLVEIRWQVEGAELMRGGQCLDDHVEGMLKLGGEPPPHGELMIPPDGVSGVWECLRESQPSEVDSVIQRTFQLLQGVVGELDTMPRLTQIVAVDAQPCHAHAMRQ